jgi:hypothetical protein
MIHQLRICEIFDTNKAAFHVRFRDHATRIMRKYDFRIVAMWESRHAGRSEFVYILEWLDEAAKTAAWSGFMADEEWAAIKRETAAKHGTLVGTVDDRILHPTVYSPRLPSVRG